MTDSTLLVLSSTGIPPYSARGLKQTLTPIGAAANLKRTINGELLDLGDEVLRKYASSITGSDVDPPAMDMVWPGTAVTVTCIQELSQTDATDVVLGRTPAGGSTRHADGFVFYRPVLSMKVVGWDSTIDEWGRVVDWTLNLEEV